MNAELAHTKTRRHEEAGKTYFKRVRSFLALGAKSNILAHSKYKIAVIVLTLENLSQVAGRVETPVAQSTSKGVSPKITRGHTKARKHKKDWMWACPLIS